MNRRPLIIAFSTLLVLALLICPAMANWTQIGQDIDGDQGNDAYANIAISLNTDGSVVAIGYPHYNGNGTRSGKVRVYENVSGIWTQIGADINGESAWDEAGTSVSLSADGSVVAVGVMYDSTFIHPVCGSVRVYKNMSGSWTLIGQAIFGEDADNQSGQSVSLSSDGSVVAIQIALK